MIGKKLTIFSISSMMASTTKIEATITGFDADRDQYIFRKKKQRKQYYLPKFDQNDIVFEGWDLPIQTDHEASNIFRGNACYNLVGQPEIIRDYVDHKNLNPHFKDKANIVLIDPAKSPNGEEQESLLYPELPSTHAVIERIKNR